jgi:hypothetical protein
MGALIILGIVIAAVVFDLLALARGADTRPGFDGMSRTPDRVIPA